MTDFATLLAQSGLLSPAQLEHVQAERARTGHRLSRILIEDSVIDEKYLFDMMADLFGHPRFNLRGDPVEPTVGSRCDETWVRTYGIVPVWVDLERSRIHVATPDPTRKPLIAQVRGRTGLTAWPLVASESETEALYRHVYRREPLDRDPARVNRSGPRPGSSRPPEVAPVEEPRGETMLEELRPLVERQQASARELRRLVELCEARGLFTRDEYLSRLTKADRDGQDPPG